MPTVHPSSEPAVSAEQYYGLIREQIEHEDELISQRLSWLVAAQSFLFTAYAIVIANAGAPRPQWASDQMRRLAVAIPLVAILTCTLIHTAIIAGLIAIRNLHRLYRSFFGAPGKVGLPPIQGYRRTLVLGQAAPVIIPVVFLTVWMVLLFKGGSRPLANSQPSPPVSQTCPVPLCLAVPGNISREGPRGAVRHAAKPSSVVMWSAGKPAGGDCIPEFDAVIPLVLQSVYSTHHLRAG